MQDKIRMTYCLLLAGIIFLVAQNIYPAFEDNAGARPFGMAGAFTAVVDDYNAVNWNAAALTRVEKTNLGLMFSKPFLGIDYDNIYSGYAGIALPLGSFGGLGVGYQVFKSDAYNETTLFVSAGVNVFKDLLSLGVTGKMLGLSYTQNDYTDIDPLFASANSKSGLSFDVSALIRIGHAASIGLVGENIFTSGSLALDALQYNLPAAYRAGLALYMGSFVPSLELAYRSMDISGNYVLDISGGFEWWTIDKSSALRAGAGLKEFTAGFSYYFGDIGIDYGFSYPLQGLSGTFGSHRVAMNVVFGKVAHKKEEVKNRMKIAIMDMICQNVDPGVAVIVSDLLRDNFFSTGQYAVLERANMDKLIKEQQFQMSGCSSTECAVELGKILNMQEMVVGSVTKLGTRYFINARMVDVESGEIMVSASTECYSDNELSNACKDLTSKIMKLNAERGREGAVKKEDESKNTEKARIAVMDVVSQNVQPGVAAVMTDLLRNNLFLTGKYKVLEKENMQKILKEQAFQASGCTTTECAIELGKVLNMQDMLISSINKLGDKYVLSTRIVNVQSGEITANGTIECYSENDLVDACKEIIIRLTNR